jgi:hypothetical protein
VITLCGLRLKFAWHAIILVAMEARWGSWCVRIYFVGAADMGALVWATKDDIKGWSCASDDSTARWAFVRLGAWRHT